MECKQQLEECISTQDFSRAAELKNSITELEELKTQLAQENTGELAKEQHAEKVFIHTHTEFIGSVMFSCLFFMHLSCYYITNTSAWLVLCLVFRINLILT